MNQKLLSITLYLFLGGLLFFYLMTTAQSGMAGNKNEAILFIGKDDTQDSSRADLVMILSANQQSKELNILSLPRDSSVSIPCSPTKAKDKLAHSYSYGDTYWKNNGRGFSCTTQTVENLMEIEKMPTIEMEMSGFADVIGKIGGIKITPTVSFCESSFCFYKNQEVILTKDNALAYVRHRISFADQDITRIKNQQQVLIAFLNTIKEMSTMNKTKYATYFFGKVKTNYPKTKMLNLLDIGDGKKLSNAIIKGSSNKVSGIYYYEINDKDLAYYRAFYRNLLK